MASPDGTASSASYSGAAAASSSSSSSSSCRKKKTEGASFVQDVRDHFDEFLHTSMDEHKACFKKTLNKMFGASRKVAKGQTPPPSAPVESELPLSSATSS